MIYLILVIVMIVISIIFYDKYTSFSHLIILSLILEQFFEIYYEIILMDYNANVLFLTDRIYFSRTKRNNPLI